MIGRASIATARGVPKVTGATRVAAPVKGIDATTILSDGDPLHCIYSFNFLPSEFGMRVRNGYREYQINLDNGNLIGVHTIIPYGGEDNDSTNDRLFAVTNEGIWDVTTDGGIPVLEIDFTGTTAGDTTSEAGYGVYTHVTTDAGDNILFYADSRNGLFRYTEATDTWAEEALITGPVIANVDFVALHKDQLWIKERDASSAWYLPTAAVAGPATQFFFGSKFKHGGNVAGFFSWTIDGGEGVDDYFVVVSRAGDVIPYKGTDPSSADTWGAIGQWFIGTIPKGPRFGTQDGGSLHLLSVYGLTSMDEIIVGVDGKNLAAETETQKISLLIRNAMETSRNLNGWDVKRIPSQSTLLINEPRREVQGVNIQYARNTTTNGWGLWRDVPIECFDEWVGTVYVGTRDGRVLAMDVPVDNVLLTPPPVGEFNGEPIKWSLLTTFQDYGQPALFKRPKYARPQFVSTERPGSTTRFRYDYDLREVINTDLDTVSAAGSWDLSLWDQAIWGSDQTRGYNPITGAWGQGRTIAIAMSGQSRAQTTLISWDVQWDSGAPM